ITWTKALFSISILSQHPVSIMTPNAKTPRITLLNMDIPLFPYHSQYKKDNRNNSSHHDAKDGAEILQILINHHHIPGYHGQYIYDGKQRHRQYPRLFKADYLPQG